MDKVYVNKLIDREDDRYTYIIVTNSECSKLISDCIETFYSMYNYENLKELLEDQKEHLDKRIYKVIEESGYEDMDDFEGVIVFTTEVLNDNNLTIESEESEIYY